jgi:hypothetical protein
MKIKANYQRHPVARFCDNPLTEALFIAYDKTSIIEAASNSPCVKNFWDLHEVYQFSLLQGLHRTHIPNPRFYYLYCKFMSFLLDTYSSRNPFIPENVRKKHALAEAFRKNDEKFLDTVTPLQHIAASMVVHGLTGTGKTSAIRMVLKCIPQVIEHESYHGRVYRQKQLVWISMDMPTTASVKALALNFFKAVDAALEDTEYHKEWSKKDHGSIEKHLNAMALVASNHELGLVHIDELQFLLKYANTSSAPTLQMLDGLFNKIGTPMVLSCTTHGLKVFLPDRRSDTTLESDMTTVRRALSDRLVHFKQLEIDGDYFISLFGQLFSSNLIHSSITIDNKFMAQFHYYTCGLPALMTRLALLFHEVVVQYASKEKGKVPSTMTILKSVYKEQFSLIEPALRQLRVNQPEPYEEGLLESDDGKAKYTNKEKTTAPGKKKKAQKAILKGGMYDSHLANELLLWDDPNNNAQEQL